MLRRLSFSSTLFAGAFVCLPSAYAADSYWIGPNDGYWDVAANWFGSPPTSTSNLIDFYVDYGSYPAPGVSRTRLRTHVEVRRIFSNATLEQTGGLILHGGKVATGTESRVAAYTLTGGYLAGPGDLRVSGLTTLSAANLTRAEGLGTGALYADGGLRLEGTTRIERRLFVTGDIEMAPGATLGSYEGVPALWIEPGSKMTMDSTAEKGSGVGGIPITVEGSFLKTGAGTSGIGPSTYGSGEFKNRGLVRAEAGMLLLSGGGTHTGQFETGNTGTI